MIKLMAIIFFMCGTPTGGIVTNSPELKEKYLNPNSQVAIPKREDVDIYRIDIEKLSGLRCA